jgi:WD40 repeat protein
MRSGALPCKASSLSPAQDPATSWLCAHPTSIVEVHGRALTACFMLLRQHSAKVWDVQSGTELRTLAGHSGVMWSVSWQPEGSLVASGSADKTARVWDTDPGAQVCSFERQDGVVRRVAWSPDGGRLASILHHGTGP